MNKLTKSTLIAVLAVAGLALAYYAVSPLFRNKKVDESLPMAVPVQASLATSSETGSVEPVEQTIQVSAQVLGTPAHPASGSVRIVTTPGKTYVRYEDFKTINGPDIYVYLAKDLDAKDFVNLGKVKATEGNINYEVPDGVDIAEYRYVLTWCKTFHVLFNYADLQNAL